MSRLNCLLMLLVLLMSATEAYLTREDVNRGIKKDESGVFLLNEESFDDFINYNDLVLICFYDSSDLQPVIRENLVAIDTKVKETKATFSVGMVELAMNPMLEARYTPLTPPDFRIFYKASGIRFLGAPDLELITDWVLRKIGLPNNRIKSQREIRDKLSKSSLLTVFISEKHKADDEFNNYLEVSRRLLTLNDVEFAYAFIEDFEKEIGNLGELVESNFYKRWGFSVRVYRRGNIADFKDMRYANLYDPAEVTAEDIERFIFRSTFVGDGPDFIREANTENVMKFFH